MRCIPTKEEFEKRVGWVNMTRSVIDSSSLVTTNVLLGFRLGVFLFSLFAYVSDYALTGTEDVLDTVDYFKYLTHWNSSNVLIYFGLAACFTLLALRNPEVSKEKLSANKLACFTHFMFELTCVSSLFVTILYWVALWPVTEHKPQGYHAFLNIAMHALPGLFVIVDLFINNQILVHSHLIPLYAYVILYLIVNAIVSVADNPVYSIMTFKSVTTAIWVAIAFGLVIFLWGVMYAFIRLRAKCCSPRAKQPEKPVPPNEPSV